MDKKALAQSLIAHAAKTAAVTAVAVVTLHVVGKALDKLPTKS